MQWLNSSCRPRKIIEFKTNSIFRGSLFYSNFHFLFFTIHEERMMDFVSPEKFWGFMIVFHHTKPVTPRLPHYLGRRLETFCLNHINRK